MLNIFELSAIVKHRNTIKYVALNDRLVVAQVQTTAVFEENVDERTRAHMRGVTTEKTKELVLTTENLQRLLNGQDYTMEDLYAVSDAYLETARTKGYLEAAIEHPTPISACNWFTRVERGEKLRMVRPERDLQMLFDDQGEVLPTAIPYDYINGHMRDGVYDLKRAQSLLDGHSQIFPINGKNLRVRPVPSYNVSPGCKKTLSFWFAPTQEQMKRIWGKAQDMSCDLHQAVWELDILGLRTAGIAFGETYFYSRDDE